MERVIRIGTGGFAAFAVLLFAVTLMGGASLWTVVGLLFLSNAFLGLVIPSAMVMALDPHPEIAGLASSLGGTLQMIMGALAVMLAAPFFDGSPLPMVAAITLCALVALAIALTVLKRPERPEN